MSAKNQQTVRTQADVRAALEADVEAFLKSGKKITQIETGVSGQDPMARSKHITLGRGNKK